VEPEPAPPVAVVPDPLDVAVVAVPVVPVAPEAPPAVAPVVPPLGPPFPLGSALSEHAAVIASTKQAIADLTGTSCVLASIDQMGGASLVFPVGAGRRNRSVRGRASPRLMSDRSRSWRKIFGPEI